MPEGLHFNAGQDIETVIEHVTIGIMLYGFYHPNNAWLFKEKGNEQDRII